MYFVRPGVGWSRLGDCPAKTTADGSARPWVILLGMQALFIQTYGVANRLAQWPSLGCLCWGDGGMSFDGLNAGVVGSEAVRGRGNLACAMAEPGLSLLGNNVQMEA